MRLVGRAQTTSRIRDLHRLLDRSGGACSACHPKEGGECRLLGPSIQKTDWRLAVNGPDFGNIAGGLPIPLLEDAGHDPETHPGTILTPRETFRAAGDLAVSRSVAALPIIT